MIQPRPRLDHRATCRPAQLEDGAHHHLEAAVVLGQVLVQQARTHGEAGVVDQHVDGVGVSVEAVRDALLGVAVHEVGDHRLHVHAVAGSQGGGELLEAGGVACHQDEGDAA